MIGFSNMDYVQTPGSGVSIPDQNVNDETGELEPVVKTPGSGVSKFPWWILLLIAAGIYIENR